HGRWAASRLALRATARCAAAALTRPTCRARGLADGRRGAPAACGGSGMDDLRRAPASAVAQHRIEDDEQPAHAGDEGDLLAFALGEEALIEGGDGGIAANRRERRHVEGVADARAAAGNVPLPTPGAARAREGCHADEGADLPV